MNKIGVHSSLQLAWLLANKEACLSGSEFIEPIHMFLACLSIMDDCFHEEADALKISFEEMREVREFARVARVDTELRSDVITEVRRELAKKLRKRGVERELVRLHRSDDSRRLFSAAGTLAAQEGAEKANIKHLFLALLSHWPADTEIAAVSVDALIQTLGYSDGRREKIGPDKKPASPTPLLDEFGRDLTALARAGRLPLFVGRKKEITALVRYLQRTSKRNVIILGEAGVGKTAIVEGLAQRLAGQEVPAFLRSLRIIQIRISDILAGTQFRGDMEKRVNSIVEEAVSDTDIVLFIDEIHLAVHAGAGSPIDVANLLKPALARDDFRCIGATTFDEFERSVKADSALRRRFQVIWVAEPLRDDALEICEHWARRIEERQQVTIDNESIAAAVDLSTELVRDRFLPDKAIDLLENAAVLVKLPTLSGRASYPMKEKPAVQIQHIKAALEEQFGISADRGRILDLEGVEALWKAEIVGQEAAMRSVLQDLRAMTDAHIQRPGPLSVMLFTGPTGTGKTLAADCLGRAIFMNRPQAIARFNMNEFKERHELARLIGAPPGFIGHDQPGGLIRFVESNPQGLIVLDEMEKAHPEIQDYFLQIFDRGEARDTKGRLIDFKPYIFIMACNTLREEKRPGPIGFSAPHDKEISAKGKPVDGINKYFRREFLARISSIIEFVGLQSSDYVKLLEKRLSELNEAMAVEHECKLKMTETAKSQFVNYCISQPDGCRGFNRFFDQMVAIPSRRRAASKKLHCVEIERFENYEPLFASFDA
jgi:ATP-dependent Clp protease ATP-binding subunit ClpC